MMIMKKKYNLNKNIIDWKVGDKKINFPSCYYAIGNFDGVHCGHQKLINFTKKEAKKNKYPCGVITFIPHPRSYFRPDDPAFIINNYEEKIDYLSNLGLDFIINILFNKNLQQMSPEDFIKKVLLGKLNVEKLFAGNDFAFGKSRAGRINSLSKTLQNINFKFFPIQLLLDKNSSVVSSSRIRAALQSGQIENAKKMLGRDPMISGIVVKGEQFGRKINFPTANIQIKNRLIPAFGVYTVQVSFSKNKKVFLYNGIANIGVRPTVKNRGLLLEVFIFDFKDNIYRKKIKVHLKSFLRPEKKFANLEELKKQIKKDVEKAKNFFIK